MAPLQALLVFRLLPDGFCGRDVRDLPAGLPGKDADEVSTGPTGDRGLHHAGPSAHIDTRLLQPGLAQLTDLPAATPLRTAAGSYQGAPDVVWEDRRS